jgi:hypothetical protein
MCAIFGSYDLEKLKDLYVLNKYRGELAYSLACFEYKNEKVVNQLLWSERKPFPEDTWELLKDMKGYFVAHIQAPTTDTEEIQPSVFDNSLLWHNGIIKQKELEEGEWDTRYLHKSYLKYSDAVLSDMNGTFACVLYKSYNLYVFRNEISPLYFDDNLNISSTEFEGSKSLPPNHVFRYNFITKKLKSVGEFTTKENPYFIAE